MKKKYIVLPLAALLIPAVLYLLFLRFPHPFFGYCERVNNLRIYYHGDDSGRISEVAKHAFQLISESPLYSKDDEYSVFLTGSAAEYALYTSIFRKSGGFYNVIGNAFIRPSVIWKNRLITPGGALTGEDRPLHYYIAHETTHAMTCRRIGIMAYFATPLWIREGVAEFTAREKPDFRTLIFMNCNRPEELDGHGSYLRYKLRVEYLSEVKGMTVPEILKYQGDVKALDPEIMQYAKSSAYR